MSLSGPIVSANRKSAKGSFAFLCLSVSFIISLTASAAQAGPFTKNSTQPNQLVDKLEPPAVCAGCHGEPIRDWAGGMMGNDFRDPSFLAMLSIAEQDTPGIGDFCLRCHAAGWWEGKSEPPGGDVLGRTFGPPPAIDRESIPLCDFCHRVESVGMRESRYNGRLMAEGEGSFYVRPDDPWKGGKHPLKPLHKEGEFCGSCHDVSNPAMKSRNDPSLPHPLERTYTEWKFSAASENNLTCQQCHRPMKFPGAQTWLLYPAMAELYPNVDEGWRLAGYPVRIGRSYAWMAARERNEALMKQAATVKITAPARILPGTSTTLSVTVINNTGHKLPTGFAEGRQLWIYLKVTDASGRTVFDDGKLDPEGRLIRTPQTKVYEQQAGIDGRKSFHFTALNTIIKDNRIPPSGFNRKAYRAEGAFIIGAKYEDGQNWDETEYKFEVPPDVDGPLKVEAALRYETFSYEFMQWLRETDKTLGANHGGPAAATPQGYKTWGEATYGMWEKFARGRPVEMASVEVSVPLASGVRPFTAGGILLLLSTLAIALRYALKRFYKHKGEVETVGRGTPKES